MEQIRTTVFETNSSSSHSITLATWDDGVYESFNMDEIQTVDGVDVVTLIGGIYGGVYDDSNHKYKGLCIFDMNEETQEHSKPFLKANFLWVYYCLNPTYSKDKFFGKTIKDIIRDVIRKQVGVDVKFNEKNKKKFNIDDDYTGPRYHDMFMDEELIRNFIFNPNSVLAYYPE